MCRVVLALVYFAVGSSRLHLFDAGDSLVLQNANVLLRFDLVNPGISELRANAGDPSATTSSGFGPNLLSSEGVFLEYETWSVYGQVPTRSCAVRRSKPITYSVLTNNSDLVTVEINGVADAAVNASVSSTWALSLAHGAMGVDVNVTAVAVQDLVANRWGAFALGPRIA